MKKKTLFFPRHSTQIARFRSTFAALTDGKRGAHNTRHIAHRGSCAGEDDSTATLFDAVRAALPDAYTELYFALVGSGGVQ